MARRTQELTPREREVLDLVRVGLTNDEIAERLSITSDGVKYHVSQILTKLDVSSRHEAVAVAYGQSRYRWTVALAWKVLKAAGAVAAVAVVGFLAIVLWGVLRSDQEEDVSPGRVGDVFRAVASAVSSDDQIFHTQVSVEQNGTQLYSVEMWVDGQQKATRYDVTPIDQRSDGASTTASVIVSNGYAYVREWTGGATREETESCDGVEAWISAVILCEKGSELSVEDGAWDGRTAIVLIGRRSVTIPTPEPNLVTPHATEQQNALPSAQVDVPSESLGGVETFVSRTYLDPATYLPIARASQQRINGEPVDELGDPQWIYANEFLPRTDELLALFDPKSIGYSDEQ
jgi:DNA-binding CsgD family transcriptional regulator